MGSWDLGEPSAKVVTSEAGPSEEALERRTRRTRCGRSCGSPGVMGRYLSESLSCFACVVGPKGVITGANCVGETEIFGRSRERTGGRTDHMRCWYRSTVYPEVVVRRG